MKNKFNSLLAIFCLSAIFYSCQSEQVDLLIHNATIYTVDGSFSIAEAMAIKDGEIVAVGANNAIKNKYAGKNTIDAELKPVFPGFIDAHCHFLGLGNTFFTVDLVGTKSWEEVLSKTLEFADKNKEGWITGRGWDHNDWPTKSFPNKKSLDSLFPNRPVLLSRVDGHAAIANQKALELAKVDVNTFFEGGIIEMVDGNLSGILIDNAVDSVRQAIPEQTQNMMKKALLAAEEACFSKGLTTLDDAYLENTVAHLIDEMHTSNELKIKVYGMLSPSEENKTDFLKNGPYLKDKLSIRSFKYFADGALGSRGARLNKPYHDDPQYKGLFLNDSLYFMEEAKALNSGGYQMNTHCIGDAANRMMLKIYAEVLKGTNDKRWRIEHAQVVDPVDLSLFKKNNIIPSVQPTHATSDMYWAEDRLGAKRIQHAYAYKTLLKLNGLISLGTDFPVEDHDPLKTFYAACIRKDANEYPDNGFQMENALSREEALKGMTIWAAISNFEETEKGSLEVGKKADFVILDQDIMTIDPSKILSTKVLSTYLDGEEVYRKN